MTHYTSEVEYAADALRYYRGLKTGESKARVFGFVTREPQDIQWPFRASQPVPGAVITLRSGGQVFRATSDAEGRYDIGGLEAGTYQFHADMPGMRAPVAHEVTLAAGACSRENLLARAVGDLRGQMVGGPPGLLITARSAAYTGTAVRQRDGSFELRLLPPGEYTLEALGRVLATVSVREGEVAENVELRLR